MSSAVCVVCSVLSTINMALIYHRFQNLLLSSERIILWHLGFRQPPDAFAVSLVDSAPVDGSECKSKWSLKEMLQDPFLWAVPKHRRSIFRRRQRRFGLLSGFYKMMLPKNNIIVCTECGGDKETGRLCPTCYEKVKLETEAMQEAIQHELGLSPVEKEVVVLYQGEQIEKSSEYWKGKRVVEMKKERPAWFSKNLLQPTTQAPATTTAVEPKDLA